MTSNLRDAFHTAIVSHLNWMLWNEEQQSWGVYNERGERLYAPEPTVEFFGRDYPISVICDRAAVLTGPLPDHLQLLFNTLDKHSGEPLPVTYPEAVEALKDLIEAEHDNIEQHPLTEPPASDRVWERGFRQGVDRGAACAEAALEVALTEVFGRGSAEREHSA